MSTEDDTHGGPEHGADATPRRRGLVAASVAAAVVLAAAGGTYVVQAAAGGGSNAPSAAQDKDDPEPLRLDGYGGAGSGKDSGAPSYELRGEGPDGPDRAPVYRPGKVDAETVGELAEALGVEGEPVERGEAWLVGENRSGPVLRVSGTNKGQQGQWSFSRYSPAPHAKCGKIPQPDKPPRCPSTGDGAEDEGREGGQDPVSEQEAERAAAPVLRELGLAKAKLDASTTTGALRVVTARPMLGGLPVQGWDTRITVGSDGRLVRGSGALAPLAKGASYPVMDAKETLAELNRNRPVLNGRQCVKEPCDGPEGGPATVDKASFVLAAHSSEGKRVLVPSWSFSLEAGKSVNYPAVEPRLLADGGEPEPSGNDGTGSRPGSPDGSAAPPGEHVEPYDSGDRRLTVHFWGGACADYSAKAVEMKDHVRITIVEKEHDPGAPCVKIAKAMKDEVLLGTPVGDRTLVDEEGAKLPVR